MLFTINNDGAIDVSGVVDYELLVITDDIVPNKKYVDDAIALGGTATALGYAWTSAIAVQPVGSGIKTLVIGEGSTANDAKLAVVIGNESVAAAGADKAVVIGDRAVGLSTNAIAIGRISQAEHLGVAIGNKAEALAEAAVAIAVGAEAFNPNSIAIGREAMADRDSEINFSADSYVTTPGDIRVSQFILFSDTTDASETELFSNRTSTGRVEVASDSTMTFTGLVTARRTDADDESAGFKVEGVIDNNAGTVALVGTPTITILGDDSAAAWSVDFTADPANASLAVKVTGEAAKTIRWACHIDTCESRG